jgi:hypothetical protein
LTGTLVNDLFSIPDLRDVELAFTDINPNNPDRVTRLV